MPTPCPICGSARSEAGLCPRCLMGNALPSDAYITYSFQPSDPARILETLSKSIGPMPRVLLPDTAGSLDDSPLVKPASAEMPPQADRSSKVQLLGEIARGGMGAVLKGRDADLGRDLAVKVLLETHRGNPDLIRRFVEEAQIGGQLQHPGIVPVYELGTFGDARPYFTMKLVKGRTLADLLGSRKAPTDEQSRFLGIFEQIAQTVAYAHARGVIHRDLKPSNVMVGSFGEVQVMDWGLAKVLPKGGASDDASAGKVEVQETIIATARSGGDDSDLSHAGSVMGTPSYMAPEQARGEVEKIDERADVFALGSILCEIFTGQPAFVGRTSGEIQRKAALGDLADAFARLEASGADAELIELTKDCLAREADDRPSHAGAVADRISAYLAGVQARVQAAERDRAVAQAQAVEERRRRKLQAGLAGTVLALVVVGGLATATFLQQRQARIASVDRALGETTTLLDQARRNPEEIFRWKEAQAAARRVEDPAGAGAEGAQRLAQAQAEAETGLQAAERVAALRQALLAARANLQEVGKAETEAAYAAAFRDAGLDIDIIAVADAGQWLGKRSPEVIVELASYLDHWSLLRNITGLPASQIYKPLLVAMAADTDPYRNQIRKLLVANDTWEHRLRALQSLADDPRSGELPPPTALLLANILGEPAEKIALLRKVVARHPDDVWVNYTLAEQLTSLKPARREEAVQYYMAARSLRPETSHQLAHLLDQMGRGEEAEAIFRDLASRKPDAHTWGCLGRLLEDRDRPEEARAALEQAIIEGRRAVVREPRDTDALRNLGLALAAAGRVDEAIATFRTAIQLIPDSANFHSNLGAILCDLKHDYKAAEAAFREAIRLAPKFSTAHFNLAATLANMGAIDDAIASYREAIRLDPLDAKVHCQLGMSLLTKDAVDEAIACFHEAIRLRPDYSDAYLKLGFVLSAKKRDYKAAEAAYREAVRLRPDYAEHRFNLAIVLQKMDRLDEAITAFREAIRLQPDYADAHLLLGIIFCDKKHDYKAAEASFREAIRLQPDNADARHNLFVTLHAMGKLDEAIASLREAIRLRPNDPDALFKLGDALGSKGDGDGAIAAYRETIRLSPDYGEAYYNLGLLLKQQGRYAEALEEYRRGHELGSKQKDWAYPSAEWVRQAERECALVSRLEGVLKGTDKAADSDEMLAFAGICIGLKRYTASSRFFADAFAADPRIAADLAKSNRYNAACCASLAGTGRSNDAATLDEPAKAKLRDQARDWLKADLLLWAKEVEGGSTKQLQTVRRQLIHWKEDTDLAGIRDAEPLAKLPEAERKEWQALWAEVDALIAKAGSPTGKP